jgi:hypothetical protein
VAAHHPGSGSRGQIISTAGDSRPPHQCPFSSMAEADVTLNGLGWRMPRMNSFTLSRRSLLEAPRPRQRGFAPVLRRCFRRTHEVFVDHQVIR